MTGTETSAPTHIATRAEMLIRREAPALLAYFERRVQHADAADLLSDTLLVIWRRAASVPSDDQAARMWFFGIARRTLTTHHRGNGRRLALLERLHAQVDPSESTTNAPEAELLAALSRLSPIDREIMRLVHWDDFTLAQVARHVGRPAGTVRSRYSRARATLRSALE